MKYPEEMYIDSQIFAGDMDGSESNFEEKIVKTRKAHKCCVCEKNFLAEKKCLCREQLLKVWDGVIAISVCLAWNSGLKKADN